MYVIKQFEQIWSNINYSPKPHKTNNNMDNYIYCECCMEYYHKRHYGNHVFSKRHAVKYEIYERNRRRKALELSMEMNERVYKYELNKPTIRFI